MTSSLVQIIIRYDPLCALDVHSAPQVNKGQLEISLFEMSVESDGLGLNVDHFRCLSCVKFLSD